jgi:hypothetical protein
MMSRIGLAVLVLTLISSTGRAQDKPAPRKPEDVQLAIERGLFFVEHRSMLWWRNRGCATCHEGQMLVFAANVAMDRGIPVDREKLEFWTDRWVLTDSLATNEKTKLPNGLGAFSAPYFLLHRDRSRDSSEKRAQQWTEVLKSLFEQQQDDGRWDKNASEASHVTPRMALALADLESSAIGFTPEFRREIGERRKRTEQWIQARDPQTPEKTESLAGWVVYEKRCGNPKRAQRLLDELLNRRRDDGGWGIKKADPSHLLVTSVVLYSLKMCGLPDDHSVVAGTQRYLLDKQSEDGRWRELGRHFHPEAYHSAYDVWTTGFAVAALSLTLPELGPNARRQFTPDLDLARVVDQLRQAAAEGYTGRGNRTGDPTEPPEKIVPNTK